MDAAFVWLIALARRATGVLSAALGLAWLLRRSSAAAGHRLLTLTALGLLVLPALAGVLPRLELPIEFLRVESPSPAPAPAVTPRTRTTVVTIEQSTTAPAPSLLGEVAAALASGVTSQREVTIRAEFGAAAVMVWLIGVVVALVGLGRSLLRERRVLAASPLLSGRWLETLTRLGAHSPTLGPFAAVRRSSRAPCPWSSATSSKGESS